MTCVKRDVKPYTLTHSFRSWWNSRCSEVITWFFNDISGTFQTRSTSRRARQPIRLKILCCQNLTGEYSQFATMLSRTLPVTANVLISDYLSSISFEKRCRRHAEIGSVRPLVSESWKPCELHISKTNKGNFTQFWLQTYLSL